MTEKRYTDGTLAKWYYSQTDVISDGDNEYYLKSKEPIRNWDYSELLGTNELLDELNKISDENEQLKTQLYCDDEEGVCNSCKHHYLVEDNEIELGYYNSRCKKGHYECARVSLKYCEDFEKDGILND